MSGVTMRLAKADELPELHRMIEAAFRGDGPTRGWTHEAELHGAERTSVAKLRTLVDDPRQRLLVAAGTEGCTGCIAIADAGDGLAGLAMLAVDPGRQSNGLGGRLLAAAEAMAVTAFAARRIEMHVIRQRPELIDYYGRLGYRRTGVEVPFVPEGTGVRLNFVVLEKRLGDAP